MIFFRVSQNINIKITDGALVNYLKFKAPVSLENETVYMTTREDFNDLKDIFQKVDKDKYLVKPLNEENIRKNPNFPIELGILNEFEYERNNENFFELKATDIYKQLKNIDKDDLISLKGQLVEVTATDGWTWRSSLSRDDTGAGACELMLVEEVRVISSL